MTNINLHTIFRHLVGDESFLSTIVETDHKELEQKKNKKNGFNLMTNMITEYIPLAPYETQSYSLFPSKIKSFISPDHSRLGIRNITEKNFNVINVSFLNSLNILLRQDIYRLGMEDHMKNLHLLETFIVHKISRNYQIDKTKNTRKVQAANKELIKNLSEGKISHELIQCIINIFEINLLVFDLTKTEISLYWTKGNKYPHLNLFKHLHCMAYVQGNYEPVMPLDKVISKEQIQKMYINILDNLDDIKCFPDINLSLSTLAYLATWDMNQNSFMKIIEKFFNKPCKKIEEYYNDLNI